jgi:protein TonB
MEFVGNQPGRWRAWAVDSNGRRGPKSEWRMFMWYTPPPAAPPAVPGRDGVTPPRGVYTPNPPYPDSALHSKTSGVVVLQILVGEDGLVKNAKVLRPLQADLDQAALAAVKIWRFEPAQKDGRPVAANATVTVSFNLK